MRQLNKAQTILFILGGFLIVAGVGLYVFTLAPKVVSIAFLAGTILFATMQMAQRYEGTALTLKRLRGIMTAADIAFIIAGLLMFENAWHLLFQATVWHNHDVMNFEAYENYMKYINNKWVVALLIAAVLELYSMNRISYELKKQDRKTEKNIKE